MLALPPGTRIYLACGVTDMRKGIGSLAVLVQAVLGEDPFSGAVFAIRGRRGDLVKLLWHDTQGLCLPAIRHAIMRILAPPQPPPRCPHCRRWIRQPPKQK